MRMPRLAVLAMTAAVLGYAPCTRLEAGQILNGSFEAGDLSDWSLNDPSFGSAEFSVATLSGSGTYFPTDGDYFAYLKTGIDADVATVLSQSFVADAGQTLDFDVFFDTAEDLFNDYGYANLLDASGSLVAGLFYADVAAVGPLGTTGWVHVSYLIADAGEYTLEFGVANVGDNDSFFDSALGVDAVTLTAVPEPSSLGLCGVALAAWAGRRLRRRGA